MSESNRNLCALINYWFNYHSLDEDRTLTSKQLCQEFKLTGESHKNERRTEHLLRANEILKNPAQVQGKVERHSRAMFEENLLYYENIRGQPSLRGKSRHFLSSS